MQSQATETNNILEMAALAERQAKGLRPGSPSLEGAVALFIARRERALNPSGTFDKGGRWWPEGDEHRSCCNVRAPSRAYPYSLMVHCRTAEHVAQLCGQDAAAIRKAARKVL